MSERVPGCAEGGTGLSVQSQGCFPGRLSRRSVGFYSRSRVRLFWALFWGFQGALQGWAGSASSLFRSRCQGSGGWVFPKVTELVAALLRFEPLSPDGQCVALPAWTCGPWVAFQLGRRELGLELAGSCLWVPDLWQS